MSLPSNLNTLFERFSNELDNLDIELLRSIELIRERIALFPDNIASVQLFATLSNYALFAENTRRRIQETLQYFRVSENLSEQAIQEIGEDLSEQLGRLLEAKIVVGNIRIRLEK